MSKYQVVTDTTVSKAVKIIHFLDVHLLTCPFILIELNIMAETVEGKKDEADYKRLHSFPLIRVKTVA